MNDTAPAPVVTDDTLFGEVTVQIDGQERVTVTGEQLPTVIIERDPASETDPHIAIGTRDAAHLTLALDGSPVVLKPAKGRLSRRSYRVETEFEGVHRVLLPDSVPGSRLIRDGVRLGDFSSTGDGTVIAEWEEDAEVHPADAALGYALAAAFGTGGQPAWMMAVDAVSAALP